MCGEQCLSSLCVRVHAAEVNDIISYVEQRNVCSESAPVVVADWIYSTHESCTYSSADRGRDQTTSRLRLSVSIRRFARRERNLASHHTRPDSPVAVQTTREHQTEVTAIVRRRNRSIDHVLCCFVHKDMSNQLPLTTAVSTQNKCKQKFAHLFGFKNI